MDEENRIGLGMDDFDEEPMLQAEEMARVKAKIGPCVIDFCMRHGVGGRFHAEELRVWVLQETGHTSPGSSTAVLRQLRIDGVLDFECVSRRQSLYQVLSVEQGPPRPKKMRFKGRRIEYRVVWIDGRGRKQEEILEDKEAVYDLRDLIGVRGSDCKIYAREITDWRLL